MLQSAISANGSHSCRQYRDLSPLTCLLRCRLPIARSTAAGYADIGRIVRGMPDVLVSSLIESRHGRPIAEIEQDVRASTLQDTRIGHALGLELGSPVLKIVRRYIDEAGETFEVSVTIHPAETFSVTTRLKRTAG
ncbi:UTRA domain-containing protein [Cupriavidus sp. SS-3]|uniref:UTRA domain-containing protein n=1 Tax=Cupriavidus sp. SS-3 TaxID=3109596 RepID=UPI002DBA1494|nr:UTRA domain-containing protein [Cupriavidus sp. SS-3]MEC3767944.1 UTRA domain-containing protein [Cupriavidus sp. SS-3]